MNNDDQKITWKQNSTKTQNTSTEPDEDFLSDTKSVNNDDQKVTWKQNSAKTQNTPTEPEEDFLGDTKKVESELPERIPSKNNAASHELSDIAKTAADYTQGRGNPQKEHAAEVGNLQAEIEAAFQGMSSHENTGSAVKKDIPVDSAPVSVPEPLAPIQKPDDPALYEKTKLDLPEPAVVPSDNSDEKIVRTLEEEIQRDLDQSHQGPRQENDPDQETEQKNNLGIEQTYYSDLTTAMSSNEPATMSELIKRSRFEKKSEETLSPRSKKNIAYIVGSVLFLVLALIVLIAFFGGREKVEFIRKEKVSSLVYSNLDTGINVTGIDESLLKQTIRRVIETKIPEDNINQIYYVQKDQLGNMSRLGIKDILDRTGDKIPDSLRNTIENNFTHGVYKTDQNYPFMILKSLSYDRAFAAMKEWEPEMIDDLATYFDLPPEATDRSLIQDGFEDDLVNNKNVRVVRFLPREIDRRGILKFLNLGGDEEVLESEAEDRQASNILGYIQSKLSIPVFAQGEPVFSKESGSGGFVEGGAFGVSGVNNKVCYISRRDCVDEKGQSVDISKSNEPGVRCIQEVLNGPDDTPYGIDKEGVPGYSCFDALEGNEAIGQLSTTAPVCFDLVTGDKLSTNAQEKLGGTPEYPQGAFCFDSYACYKYSCFKDAAAVAADQEGNEGVVCGETDEKVPYNWTGADGKGKKMCRQYNGLLQLRNIDDSLLCFDESETFLPNHSDDYGNTGVTCITPQQRQQRVCIDSEYRITSAQTPGALCFEPLDVEARLTSVSPDQCPNLSRSKISSLVAGAGVQLKFLAGISSLIGISNDHVQIMNSASNFLFSYAYGNILQNEAIRTGAFIVQQIESVLNYIDPNKTLPKRGPNGGLNIHGYLREIIQVTKCALGLENTLQWSALGRLPQGFTIYAGQSIEGVTDVQQALVLMGLMDISSVTGKLDLVTQDAVSLFQISNGIPLTGVLDPETLSLLGVIADQQGSFYGGTDALINDYFIDAQDALPSDTSLVLGDYSNNIQGLQSILIAEGYDLKTNSGLFDNDTCLALQQYQRDNGLAVASSLECKVSNETLQTMNSLITEKDYLSGNGSVKVYGYFPVNNQVTQSNSEHSLNLGAYNNDVQNLQVLLYAEGYDVPIINGLFDNTTCEAVQKFQLDNALEQSDPVDCDLSAETIDELNRIIREKNYLGSGFALNQAGYLEGVGVLDGTFGPGAISFDNQADANSLEEGDIVLMYMFLDEETILITPHELVIDEVIRRRAFSDIFEK